MERAGRRSCGACLTWPQLQQVMQGLDVPLEIHRAGKLLSQTGALRRSPQPPSSSPGLLAGGEEDRAEAHGQVLVGHPVEGAEGGHQAEVVQQEGQRGLRAREQAADGGSSEACGQNQNQNQPASGARTTARLVLPGSGSGAGSPSLGAAGRTAAPPSSGPAQGRRSGALLVAVAGPWPP